MIRRIQIENFMSHTRTVIEPCQSLTVLTGPNNCGKSAVAAALQVLCRNERGSYMLRHGEREAKVVVETDDDHIVEWRRRRNGTVTYVIDGREVHRGVPEDLHDVLRMPTVSMRDGSDEFDIHFGEQKQPIFLLNDPGRHAATFFASSSDAEYIVRMQAIHKQRTAAAKTLERRLSDEVQAITANLQILAPALALAENIDLQEIVYLELQNEVVRIAALEEAVQELRKTTENRDAAQLHSKPLLGLIEPPGLIDTRDLESTLSDLQLVESSHRQAVSEQQALSSTLAPPDFHKADELDDICRALSAAATDLRQVSAVNKSLARVASPPDLEPEAELALDLVVLKHRVEHVHYVASGLNSMAPLSIPPVLWDTVQLADVASTLAITTRNVEEARSRARTLDAVKIAPSQNDEGQLAEMISNLHSTIGELGYASLMSRAVLSLLSPPTLTDLTTALAVVDSLAEADQAVINATSIVTKCEQVLASVRTEILEWTSKNPICSLCGQNINADSLLRELETTVV